jgi:hypothetical protein
MIAISNGDTILIMPGDPQRCVGPSKPVATYHPDTVTLEMHSGWAHRMPEALGALRTYQREVGGLTPPVKVEYW